MGAGEAEIGTGTVAFEPLDGDQELDLIAGPQGGYHFVVHARIRGLLPGNPQMPGLLGNPRTRFAIHLEDGTRVDAALPPYRLGYGEADDGSYVLPSGRILALDDDLVLAGFAEELYGQRVRLAVEVSDAAGVTASDERWVVAREGAGQPLGDAGPPRDDAGAADAGADAAVPDAGDGDAGSR